MWGLCKVKNTLNNEEVFKLSIDSSMAFTIVIVI